MTGPRAATRADVESRSRGHPAPKLPSPIRRSRGNGSPGGAKGAYPGSWGTSLPSFRPSSRNPATVLKIKHIGSPIDRISMARAGRAVDSADSSSRLPALPTALLLSQTYRGPSSVVLDHGVEDRKQLAHTCGEGHLLALARRNQATVEGPQHRVATHCG